MRESGRRSDARVGYTRRQMKARYWIAGSALAAAGAVLWTMRRMVPARPRTHLLDLEPPLHVPDSETGSVHFIGTATALIRYQGLTILTDPNFVHRGERIHIGYGMHTTRLTDPALDFDDLPPVDFVLLSHLHEDHFDKLVERRLARHTPILTTASAARTLKRRGFANTYALRTWDRVNIRKGQVCARVVSMPGTHAAPPVSAMMPDVMGSMLELRNERDRRRYRIYISGDTLLFGGLYEIPQRYPHIDLALLHLGGARVLGVPLTMNAAQGIAAMRVIRPDVAIPIHYNDYDIFKEPLDEFVHAVEHVGLRDQVRYLYHGETYSFVPRGAVDEARPLV
jgi:L-ascorbate metabolism protein UlaG (beta-lactamase superfamily)